MRVTGVLAIGVLACGSASTFPPPTTPAEGIAITVYQTAERSYGIVDDRRTVEVANGTMRLDRIDPGAALEALVIEPLHGTLRVISCDRERIRDADFAQVRGESAAARGGRPPPRGVVASDASRPSDPSRPSRLSGLSPIVRCRVVARDGKHLVRVLHVATSFAFAARHELAMTDLAHATITTRFSFTTPAWHGPRATLSLFEGLPGDPLAPRSLATQAAILDGSTSILAGAPRELAAEFRTVYNGIDLAGDDGVEPSDIVWGRTSHHRVWRWLELSTTLATGPIRAHVELAGTARDVEIEAAAVEHDADSTRFPLWIDEDLLGTRTRAVERADGVSISDRIQLSVANLGDVPREVFVDERLRFATTRRIHAHQRMQPQVVHGAVRAKLSIAPGKTERIGWTIDYEPRD